MRALAGLAVAAVTLAGCARLPEHIAESYVSEAYYQAMSCPELTTALANVRKEARLAASEQSRFVGVLFPSREYERNTQRIAELKGALAAIERAQTMTGCGAAGAGEPGEDAALPSIDAEPADDLWGEDDDIAADEDSL